MRPELGPDFVAAPPASPNGSKAAPQEAPGPVPEGPRGQAASGPSPPALDAPAAPEPTAADGDRGPHRLLQLLFFWLVVRPVVLVGLGLNVRHRERLPAAGPAIVVANHNSHLDTVVLMALFPSRLLHRVRPLAAADYFLRNPAIAWFSRRVMGILPVERRGGAARPADPLALPGAALGRGDIVVLFPEGTRGEPERLASFKSGVGHLARRHPAVPVVPVFLHGLGKSLPRGGAVPVPFFCDVFVGEPLFGTAEPRAFVGALSARMTELAGEGQFAPWE
jgi:1-acyl-sn-glycerol-3-phosphate acyltransferase